MSDFVIDRVLIPIFLLLVVMMSVLAVSICVVTIIDVVRSIA